MYIFWYDIHHESYPRPSVPKAMYLITTLVITLNKTTHFICYKHTYIVTAAVNNIIIENNGCFTLINEHVHLLQCPTVFAGSLDSISMRAVYICSGVPSKNRPHPPLNNVSPEQK